ncbi:hypothetical protein ACFL2S_10625 [Thermodesulfobacteriota bacterium]
MDKIISKTIYWDSFFENNPDPEPLRAFIATDAALIKIFNIVAVPNILFSIDTYPFDEKLSEFSSISRDERQRLYDLRSTKGFEKDLKVVEYLDWLVAVYELVKVTLWYYQALKNIGGLSGEELIEMVVSVFREKFSKDEEYLYENNKGERFEVRLIGRKFYDIWLKILGLPGKDTIQLHFLNKPTKEEIEYFKNDFDFGSAEQFKKFRPHADEITFGNNSSNPDKYTVQFYYKGKKIGKNFKYPIISRYEPLMKNSIRWIDDETKTLSDSSAHYAVTKLFFAACDFDPSMGVRPAGWFKANFKHLKSKYSEEAKLKDIKTDHSAGSYYDEEEEERKLVQADDLSKEDTDIKYRDGVVGRALNPDETNFALDAREGIQKILEKACEDEMDRKIIKSILEGKGDFEESDNINFSAIAEELDTYKNDIKRRWDNIKRRAGKIPSLKNFFK